MLNNLPNAYYLFIPFRLSYKLYVAAHSLELMGKPTCIQHLGIRHLRLYILLIMCFYYRNRMEGGRKIFR